MSEVTRVHVGVRNFGLAVTWRPQVACQLAGAGLGLLGVHDLAASHVGVRVLGFPVESCSRPFSTFWVPLLFTLGPAYMACPAYVALASGASA